MVGSAERSIEGCLVMVDGHGLAEEVSGYIDGSVIFFRMLLWKEL
jgi:hypothetical protein